jgi:UDP-N-acetylmuramate--alanine ligase
VWKAQRRLATVNLRVPGRHNVLDALAAFATLAELGLSPEKIVPALETFTGAVRRFQLKGERDGVTVVDDYAHHPTELRATLSAAREGGWSRVIAVFQPHLYSRTEYLQTEFAEALLEADVAIVTDVYGAREDPLPGVSGKLIVDGILRMQKSKPVVYLPRLGSIVEYLERATAPGDLVLTLGAGDVHRIGERFLAPA